MKSHGVGDRTVDVRVLDVSIGGADAETFRTLSEERS